MTFTPSKPDSGPSPALDASIIQTNFAQFQTVFSVNHLALNDPNQGKHGQVVLPVQASDPGVTNDLTVLYAKNATATTGGTQPQLFVQIPKFLPTPPVTEDVQNSGMQLTYNQVNVAGPQYQSFLPGGYLLYTSKFSGVGPGNVNQTITLVPTPTKILIAIATANTTLPFTIPNLVSTNITGSNTFDVSSTGLPAGAYTFSWFAIAKA